MWNLLQLYRRHLAAGSFQPESFRKEAAYHSEGDAMYAFQYCPVQGQDTGVLHFEYLGVMEDPEGVEFEEDDEDDDAENADNMMVDEDAAGSGDDEGEEEMEAVAPVVEASEPAGKRQRR